jgi:uracil-DNA glycosylase
MTKKQQLYELKKRMEADKSLPLREGATNLVFGEGDPEAEVMFIGEGPGYWEDLKARPFVGNAGAFLNQLLSSIKLPREDVYITNVVHYRPPGNRDPLPQELAVFGRYLDKMIEIIEPKLIVTLGRFSMAKFLPNVTISTVHGKAQEAEHKGRKIMVLPMYHPAAALRSGDIRRKSMYDFQKLPDALEKAKASEAENNNDKKDNSKQMNLI